MRLWQHPSWADNKSYQCKPIRRQQDNPRDNRASTEASSARQQCRGFADNCHGWRDLLLSTPAGRQWGSPVAAPRCQPRCAQWDGQIAWDQGSTHIAEAVPRAVTKSQECVAVAAHPLPVPYSGRAGDNASCGAIRGARRCGDGEAGWQELLPRAVHAGSAPAFTGGAAAQPWER